jgi:hypothetical protein
VEHIISCEFPDIDRMWLTLNDQPLDRSQRVIDVNVDLELPFVVSSVMLATSSTLFYLGDMGLPVPVSSSLISKVKGSLAPLLRVHETSICLSCDGNVLPDDALLSPNQRHDIIICGERRLTLALCPDDHLTAVFCREITVDLSRTPLVCDVAPPTASASPSIDIRHPLALLPNGATLRFAYHPSDGTNLWLAPAGGGRVRLRGLTVRDAKLDYSVTTGGGRVLPGVDDLRFWDASLADDAQIADCGLPDGECVEIVERDAFEIDVVDPGGSREQYKCGTLDTVDTLRALIRRRSGQMAGAVLRCGEVELANETLADLPTREITISRPRARTRCIINGKARSFEVFANATPEEIRATIAQELGIPVRWLTETGSAGNCTIVPVCTCIAPQISEESFEVKIRRIGIFGN